MTGHLHSDRASGAIPEPALTYDLKSANTPRIAGRTLSAAASLLDNPASRSVLLPGLFRDGGVTAFRKQRFTEAPSVTPRLPRTSELSAGSPPSIEALERLVTPTPTPGFAFETAADFARAYRDGSLTPAMVAERFLDLHVRFDEGVRPLRAVIAVDGSDVREQAAASAERFRKGAPLGPLDGVPVAVKDELDAVPYPTTAGTRFLHQVATVDATAVARLRAAGALIVGKANMHEIGIDTTGFNPHHGTPRNPYDDGRYTGGSSSGSAAAIAAGLCPIAIGADGGGSIRLPASLCGIVGLKATWSRISEAGAFPLCWSVGHVGPMGATVRDVALAYALMAGADPRDPSTFHQPAVSIDGVGDSDLTGLRLGVYRSWMEDADADVVKATQNAIDALVARGATVVEVEIPDLESGRIAHAITILSEMATSMDAYPDNQSDFGAGVRLLLRFGRELTSRDFVRAQQVRTRLSGHFDRAFERADVLITPTTAITAPPILPDAEARGDSDLLRTSALMRFVFPANLTGHPALSVPGGYDASGLPIGIQLMGRPWEEHVLLRAGAVLESVVERRAPKTSGRLLG